MTQISKILCSFIGIAGILLVCVSLSQAVQSEGKKSSPELASYYVEIPVTFTFNGMPCLTMTIDRLSFCMLLDLGFRGHVSLLKRDLERIASKQRCGSTIVYNFRGLSHAAEIYSVPKLSMGSVFWQNPILKERSECFAAQVTVTKDSSEPRHNYDGAVGWELFQGMNLLLDMENAKVVICDSVNTLQGHGYKVDSWVKTPLLLDRGLVEFEATTPEGRTRCSLDTGTTFNVVNKTLKEKTLAELTFDPNTFMEYPFFKIEDIDFGPQTFRQVPINLPIPVPVTLGMEFFHNHKVFIDFTRQFVFFYKELLESK